MSYLDTGYSFQRLNNVPIDKYNVVETLAFLDYFAHGGILVGRTYEGQLTYCIEDETLYIFKKDSEDHFYYEPAQTSLGFEVVTLQLEGETYSPDLGEDDPLTGTIYKASGTFEDQESQSIIIGKTNGSRLQMVSLEVAEAVLTILAHTQRRRCSSQDCLTAKFQTVFTQR